MADALLTPLIEKLVELLADEVSLLKGVHKEVESLKDELEILQPFLKDAEAKSEKEEVGEAAKVWLKQMREKVESIEDVIDDYLHHLVQQRAGLFHKAGQFIESLKLRHDIASEIRDIKESLREVKERGQSLGLRPFEQGSSRGSTSSTTSNDATKVISRLSSLYIEDEDLVGIDSTSNMLKSRLVGEPSARAVISLVGEGGIGKTTLAKRVFKDEAVKGHFDCRVWVTVSQSYDVQKILRIMKNKICPKKGQAGEEIITIEELISALRQSLETKRYVVVFDDVWQTDFWDVMKLALPDKNKGSRIIVTTRNRTVVQSFKETPFDFVHELQTWSSDPAWELFCKNAFRYEFEGKCPEELEELSQELVKKCQGLPLVLVAVAGLLSKKEEKTKFEWQNMLDNLNHEFEKNPQLANVSKVLSLSYHDLPSHLKPCFLYFGIFPEDYSILEGKLYTLWIAEGFIKSRRDKTLEQVAKEYLDELIARNLVSFDIRYGIEKHCRVHDLTRDLILTRAKESSFCQILEDGKLKFEGKSRRLSIHGTTKGVLEIVGDFNIRSLLLFNIDDLTKSFVVNLFKTFIHLKVLDFEDAPLNDLPSEVGNLFHLKYLNLQGTTLKVLPKTTGKLQNLQVLNVAQTKIQKLPIEINKLRKLRYLLAFYRFDVKESEYNFDSFYGVKVKEGLGCLEELRTLYLVEPHVARVDFIKELEKLRNLKILGIGKLTRDMGKALAASFGNMRGLEKLYANSIAEEEILDLNGIASPPHSLWHISLQCRLQEFPDWISKLENLRELNLRFSRLTAEPLKWLKGLPNLVFINMYKAYDGEELHFEEGGFPRLKQLRLRNLEGLKVVKIDKGALPVLEKFALGPSPLMKEMPSGIQHLTNLKSLDFRNMSREFVLSLQPIVGPDYVPSVTCVYKNEFYKLGSSELLQRLQE